MITLNLRGNKKDFLESFFVNCSCFGVKIAYFNVKIAKIAKMLKNALKKQSKMLLSSKGTPLLQIG